MLRMDLDDDLSSKCLISHPLCQTIERTNLKFQLIFARVGMIAAQQAVSNCSKGVNNVRNYQIWHVHSYA